MKKTITGSIAAIIFLASALIADAESPKPVTVENTPNVNIANTPAVQAQQNGNWNVSINGTPGVTIQNGPLNPVPVTTPSSPRQPFQTAGQFQLLLAVPSASINLPVPNGKILVIEQVSAFVDFLPEPQEIVYLQVLTEQQDGSSASFYFPVPKVGTAGTIFISGNNLTGNAFAASHAVRLYGASGTNVRFLVQRSSGQVTGFEPLVRVSLSGYLVPTDSPNLAP